MRALLFALLLLPLAGCTGLFFHPSQTEVLHPQRMGLAHEDVYITTADGLRLHGWYLRAARPRGTVLYLHGNAENISTFIALVHWLPAAGYNVLLLDYRGYGRSQGTPHAPGLHRDAAAALDWLITRGGVDAEQLVVLGHSLGGSVAIRAVADSPHRTRIRGVATEGAFSSYRRIARQKMKLLWLTRPLRMPLGYLINDDYAAEDVVARLAPVPLFIIHGEQDAVVTPDHAQRLFERAGEPRELWLRPRGGHVNSLHSAEGRERLREWLERVTTPMTP